jgi:hypothetical protein
MPGMSEERKGRGAKFWIIAALVAVVVYAAGYGLAALAWKLR